MSMADSVTEVNDPCNLSLYFRSILTTICALCSIGTRVAIRRKITPAVGLCLSSTSRSKSLSEVISNAFCWYAISNNVLSSTLRVTYSTF